MPLRPQCEIMENIQRASSGFCTTLPHGLGAGSPCQDHVAIWSDQHGNYTFPRLPAGGGRAPPWGGTADARSGTAGWQPQGTKLL